jgi:hypothetical protein
VAAEPPQRRSLLALPAARELGLVILVALLVLALLRSARRCLQLARSLAQPSR